MNIETTAKSEFFILNQINSYKKKKKYTNIYSR